MTTTAYKNRLIEQQNHPCNLPADYETLTLVEKAGLQAWIARHVQPGRLSSRTSYGVKHDFERDPAGFYITNGQFKGAMLVAGYNPCDQDVKHDINWRFYAKFEKSSWC
jgi:hypothetical protein